jgi:hypothetical protein
MGAMFLCADSRIVILILRLCSYRTILSIIFWKICAKLSELKGCFRFEHISYTLKINKKEECRLLGCYTVWLL